MSMNADLNNLQGLAAQADAEAIALDTPAEGPGAEVQAGPQAPDYQIEARGAVDLFSAMVVGYAPKAESVWTEPAKARTAAALAPVLEKYGFTFGALPCELTFVIVAGPLLWQSSRIVAAQMAEEKAKAKKEEKPEGGEGGMASTVANAMAPEPTGQPEAAPAPTTHPQMALYK